jgi:7,8-dihydropterin-6-yl-methyl-4-(beta-D-ribofuranosyl)aminobenzene 5'-phosphate synthase
MAGCFATESGAATAPPPHITVLFDAFGQDAAMTKDWGYSALVQIGGKRILFDTGGDSDILARNAEAKGVDLSKLDFVVLSHRHSDHLGGLSYLLRVNPKIRIYAPKENFGVFGSDLPGTFYRRTESLPPWMRYYDGKPPETMRFGTAFPGANIQSIDKTTRWLRSYSVELVSDTPDRELKELSRH